jgi:hypothetical protein
MQQSRSGRWGVLLKRCKQKGVTFTQLTNPWSWQWKSELLILDVLIFTRALVKHFPRLPCFVIEQGAFARLATSVLATALLAPQPPVIACILSIKYKATQYFHFCTLPSNSVNLQLFQWDQSSSLLDSGITASCAAGTSLSGRYTIIHEWYSSHLSSTPAGERKCNKEGFSNASAYIYRNSSVTVEDFLWSIWVGDDKHALENAVFTNAILKVRYVNGHHGVHHITYSCSSSSRC